MVEAPTHRGDVWQVDFDPVRGHEQGRRRPAVVVSADTFNAGPAGLVIVCPITTRDRGVRLHVAVDPPEGGLGRRSFVLCDQVRTLSKDRMTMRMGRLGHGSMRRIDDRLRLLLDL